MGNPSSKRALRALSTSGSADEVETSNPVERIPRTTTPEPPLYEMLTHTEPIWCTAGDASWYLRTNPEICLGTRIKDRANSAPRAMTPEEKQQVISLSESVTK